VGKTFKDIRDFDVRRNKENSRKTFKNVDLRTRVKPIQKKERGGAKNWRHEINTEEE
jgi:hypothetical protein